MLYSLITEFTSQVVTKLSKGHDESINHLRSAEIEFLKGIRTFINEEIRFLDRWLEKKSQPAAEKREGTGTDESVGQRNKGE